ncbi:MAG: hypothetical protein KGD59_11765 [Candidatus Heimdallarchaeota archaeon]|nr:hypothetical protein [Candidatus Heimdallarchaeota archaeon]
MYEPESKEDLYKYHKEEYKRNAELANKFNWISCCIWILIIPWLYFYIKAINHRSSYKALEKELSETPRLE